jgi:alpha-tubulin suppressor-like RCC1 family protein
MSKSHSKLPRD